MRNEMYDKIQSIREDYRQKMNYSTSAAQKAAAEEDMSLSAMHSSDAERYREAFAALNRVFRAIDAEESKQGLSTIDLGWPHGCRDASSCNRHEQCMYVGCRWQGREIKPL